MEILLIFGGTDKLEGTKLKLMPVWICGCLTYRKFNAVEKSTLVKSQ
jgi:hypothetical protein